MDDGTAYYNEQEKRKTYKGQMYYTIQILNDTLLQYVTRVIYFI